LPYVAQSSVKYSRPAEPVAATKLATKNCAKGALTTRWIAEYRQLLELREIPGAFLLYFDRSSYHLIPKRGFSQKQVDQFRDIAGPRIAHQNVSR
jgi:hypothetical protein